MIVSNLAKSSITQSIKYLRLWGKTQKHQQKTKLEAQWAEPVSLTFHSALRKLNTRPSIGATHQIVVHFAKQFQRRSILEIDQ